MIANAHLRRLDAGFGSKAKSVIAKVMKIKWKAITMPDQSYPPNPVGCGLRKYR